MKPKIDLSNLDKKRLMLNNIAIELKKEFFGIDNIIDDILKSIQTWFLLPDIITRPIIVNLWGLTGVGKTALVRSLVKKLQFSDKFVEIQMDTSSSPYNTTICGILQNSSIEEKSEGIIFLDEFQRFRTIEANGSDVKNEKFQDIWMLLSDGKFSIDSSYIKMLEEKIAEDEYYEDDNLWRDSNSKLQKLKKEKNSKSNEQTKDSTFSKSLKIDENGEIDILADESENESQKQYKENEKYFLNYTPYTRKYTLSIWEAKNFKKLLRLSESLKEIMTWDKLKITNLIKNYIENKKNDSIDFSKCLIFISGNLDEAFTMSENISDADTEADLYHKYTKKINVTNIKSALSNRFKPEQISRLGNNHIIYPSLSKFAYLQIIHRACNQYLDELNKICDIQFEIDPSVYTEIYDNSVYPTQGTRPVFSSINKLFGSPLSDGILWALENNITNVIININSDNKMIFIDKKSLIFKEINIDLELKKLRKRKEINTTTYVAVHEMGHALVHILLTKKVPAQIKLDFVKGKENGWVISEKEYLVLEDLEKKVCVLLGGYCAIELIFGKQYHGIGAENDLVHATFAIGRMIRKYGMYDYLSYQQVSPDSVYNENIEKTNQMIEDKIQEFKKQTMKLLNDNIYHLIELSKVLIEKKKLNDKEFYLLVKDTFQVEEPSEEKDWSIPFNDLFLQKEKDIMKNINNKRNINDKNNSFLKLIKE